jgi:hypothetical protein
MEALKVRVIVESEGLRLLTELPTELIDVSSTRFRSSGQTGYAMLHQVM